MHVDKSFTKIQARDRPPPIPAMPVFWELLVRHSIPKRNKFQVQHFKPFSALCTSVSSYSSTLKILMTAITPPMVFQYIADNKIKGREGSKQRLGPIVLTPETPGSGKIKLKKSYFFLQKKVTFFYKKKLLSFTKKSYFFLQKKVLLAPSSQLMCKVS